MNRRVRSCWGKALGFVGLVGFLPVAHAAERPALRRWTPPAAYREALQAVQAQQWAEAIERLEESLQAAPPRPDDATQAAAGYVPYLYLAYAYARLGRPDAAEAFYRLARRFGGYEHRADLQSYATFIEKALKQPPEIPAVQEDTSAPSVFYRDRETEASADCQVSPARDPYSLPWYFHYALGKELLERGRLWEALRSLRRALSLNPRPESQARTYGMWHTEYLPYYYMTQAFLKLNRRDCAAQTARESMRFREVTPGGQLYPEWRQVLKVLGLEAPPP